MTGQSLSPVPSWPHPNGCSLEFADPLSGYPVSLCILSPLPTSASQLNCLRGSHFFWEPGGGSPNTARLLSGDHGGMAASQGFSGTWASLHVLMPVFNGYCPGSFQEPGDQGRQALPSESLQQQVSPVC